MPKFTKNLAKPLMGIALLCGLVACGESSSINPFLGDQILNIAHRGGRVIAPEATLEAFASALAVGADVLEFDIHTTSDGTFVVMHDTRVDRTTDGTGRIDELTWAEISQLDAGYWFSRDDGVTYPYRGQEIHVPRLSQVLETFPGVPVNIEIKTDIPLDKLPELAEILRTYNRADKALVASFGTEHIQAFRVAAPEILTSFSLDEVFDFFILSPETETTYTPPTRMLQVPPTYAGLEVLTEDFVAKARRHELRVIAFDILTAAEMQAMIDLGLDGQIVDDPALLAEVLAAQP